MAVNIECVAHLHGGPHNDARLNLYKAILQIPMPVWGDSIDDSTTALYRLRRYSGQAVVHYDYVEPAAEAELRRTGGVLRWLWDLCR